MTYGWAVDIATRVKQQIDVPVIFGGVHPSAVPEVCLEEPAVDYVCVGEGEEAMVRLCEDLAGGLGAGRRPARPIPNLWWRGEDGGIVRGPASGFVQDLDSLPFWDKELWENDVPIGTSYLTMTSRGCPYRCTFCFNNFFAKLAGPGPARGKYRSPALGREVSGGVGRGPSGGTTSSSSISRTTSSRSTRSGCASSSPSTSARSVFRSPAWFTRASWTPTWRAG